ncbi:MAG: hypothetical protein HZA92_00220 [Verrucomicrobia bacterium]|nr:hypothetical protein [Verrucomicrobiota bacterium]
MKFFPFIICLLLILLVSGANAAEVATRKTLAAALQSALAKEDLTAVRVAVAAERSALGEKAGVPEVADKHVAIPKSGRWLTPAEAQRGFTPQFAQLEKLIWWRVGIDPAKLTQPLRAPASVLSGCVAVCRAKLDGAERSLAIAKDAAEFLMWAQEQAGGGLFPFPAARGTSGARAMAVASNFLDKAEKAGKLDQVVRNGWACDDLGDGGLQFDNGECGVAMFELYEFTRDARHLNSARKAADWAAARPLCANWNYNSFSVQLLAKAFEVTGEKSYLDAACKKALVGVIPGQLTDGPRAGRWLDAHNARPAYHYIMLRALGQLASVMPKDDPARAEVLRALTSGLHTRNQEIVTQGLMNKDKAIEALLLVSRRLGSDKDLLRASLTVEALDVAGRLVSELSRRSQSPLGPGEWGLFLEAAKQKSP